MTSRHNCLKRWLFSNNVDFSDSDVDLSDIGLISSWQFMAWTCMVAYFCHHLSDKYVDLSDIYVDLSDLYVDLSDLYVDLSLIPSVEK